MLTRFGDFERSLAAFDDLFRQMSHLHSSVTHSPWQFTSNTWGPEANLYDDGKELVMVMLTPGFTDKDVKVSASRDTLTVSGQRECKTPEGYSVHREERSSLEFTRSFALPCQIDVEKVKASAKNGVLTIVMGKGKDAKPREIAVKAS